MTAVEDSLRAWAHGRYTTEAGVELLIRHGKAIYDGAPWISRHDGGAHIDVDKLLYESGVWSSSEQQIVQVAASLLGGPPADLNDTIPGLSRANLALVLAAIAHAGGSHDHGPTPFLRQPDGSVKLNPDRHTMLGSLYPWPGEDER
ncbi:MAG TPA: hypothetical protein VIP77_05545 [Jiangellaceae bacterium]